MEPPLSREEFIEGYLANSGPGPPDVVRTETGFIIRGMAFTALPCDCGDYSCRGWRMEVWPVSEAR
jgi:hypothetical protein